MRLLGRAAGGAISLVALHIGTHYFGPARWGPIVAATAFVAVFAAASDFGVQQIASRDLAAPGADSRAILGAALAAVPITALPATAVAAAIDFAVYAGHPGIRTLVLLLLATVPCTALWLVSSSVFVARARNDVRALLDVGSSALVLAAISIVGASHAGSDTYLALVTVSTAATAGGALVLARRYVVPSMSGGAQTAWQLVRRSAPLGLTYSSNALYGQVDTVLVALLTTTSSLAAFGVASQIAGFVAAVPAMLMAAVTPHFMRQGADGRKVLVQRSFDTLVTIAAALPLVAVLFARGAISAVAGGRYAAAGTPLVLLVGAGALGFPTAVYGHGLVLVGAERRVPRGVYAALVVNVVGNLVAVPLAGITGAGIVMVGSEATLLVLRARAFRSAAGFGPSLQHAAIAIVAAGTLAGAYATSHVGFGLQTGHGLAMIPEAVILCGCYAALTWLGHRIVHHRRSGPPVGAS